MAELQPLTEEERAELVAYLDGEADPKSARTIEARLNRDPRYKAEAEAMRRAWQMLDFLPKPEPSAHFTHRTMSAAVIAAPSDKKSRWPWVLGLGWAAGLLIAAVTGYAGAPLFFRTTPPPLPAADAESLVRDLRVIENLRFYQAGQDIHFLNELDQPDLFGDEHAGF